MMDRVGPAATILALALATTMAGPRDPGVTAKPSGRTLGDPDTMPLEQPDFSRPERQQMTAEPTNAESDYFEAAMRGEAWAQTKLGKIYVAADDPERQRRGVELLQQAGKQNDAEAFYVLASLSAAGVGVEPSNVTAFEQMKRAADLGFADAQFALGSMYFEGLGTAKDESAAVASFRKAADGGNKEAMFSGGRILLAQPDPDMRSDGLALMSRAIESGHIEATLMLATAYGRGSMGITKDEAKAEALLKPAAERGDADCQLALASLYKFGDSFAPRRDEAQVWLQRAADQGHPKALEIMQSGER
jgi:TPR repeat protein